jgi:hypothetical protein
MLCAVVAAAGLAGLPTLAQADEPAKTAEPAKKEEGAKPDAAKDESKKVDAFAEALKKNDPAAYETFVKLRANREKQQAELNSLQQQIRKASSEEKINLFQQFKIAKKAYIESYIAFIDFLDERDKKAVTSYEENIAKLQKAIERIKGVIAKRDEARKKLRESMKEE